MRCLEAGAVETLICFEDLAVNRYVITKNKGSEDEVQEIHLLTEADAEKNNIHVHEAGKTQNEIESENFVEWLTLNYQKFGCTLELISDRSQEGTQLVRGFGGMGGILRYKMDVMALRDHEKHAEETDKVKENNEEFDFDDDFM